MKDRMTFNAKMLSMFGMNGAVFGSAIPYYHDAYKYKVLTSDMSSGAGLVRYRQKYPNDFINVGIAEQNLIGVTAGLSSEGFKCIAVAQACFLSMRSFEQIRQYFGYMGNNAIIIGINGGFALTYFGNTHYSIEDLSLMRSIPRMTVLSPADAGEAIKDFEFALEMNAPVYIRLSGTTNMPIVYNEDFSIALDKAKTVFDNGGGITIFATGTMVYNSIKAAKLLGEKGIGAKVIDINTIKPIDKEAIVKEKFCKLIVSVEEHTIIGGLGSALSEILSEEGNMPKLLRIGIDDRFSSVGDYQYLLEQNGLTPSKIAELIEKNL
jgi:transketolase